MIYLNRFYLPSETAEINFIKSEARSCFHTFYPFNIFPNKGLRTLEFDNITLLYGGNGSGKSTLINIIANKIGAKRYSEFNSSSFFSDYVAMCCPEYSERLKNSFVLPSDDVFDFCLTARSVNERIDDRREGLINKYIETHTEIHNDPKKGLLSGLDDYERWREAREILSRHHTQSEYVKKRVKRDIDLCSNGETAMRYFVDRIDGAALYLLDEPENSLSFEFQIELAEFISASTRITRSQFIIATHSPILLSIKGARIYDLDGKPVRTSEWTELTNVRKYYNFFMEHSEEFEK